MNFLNRGLLGSKKYFIQEFQLPIERDQLPEAKEKLQSLIHPFILRRTKEEVAKDLPSLTQETIVVAMSEEQFDFYETEKSAVRNVLLKASVMLAFRNQHFLFCRHLPDFVKLLFTLSWLILPQVLSRENSMIFSLCLVF